jgi:hypothetical protein
MRPIDDPCFLTPDEHLCEVAGSFAAGILRLRARSALPPADSQQEILPESWPTCLEVPAKTVLSVHTGYLFDSDPFILDLGALPANLIHQLSRNFSFVLKGFSVATHSSSSSGTIAFQGQPVASVWSWNSERRPRTNIPIFFARSF